jgi:glycosyltransferase involved in cell wall biosynthesis
VKLALVLGTSTGGTGRHVKMLAVGCAARGVRVEVFGPAQTDRDFAFGAAAPGIGFTPAEIADRPRLPGDLQAIGRLRRLFRAWRPDVVHAHGLRAGALTAVAVAFARTAPGSAPGNKQSRTPLVVTVHNAPPAGGVTGAIYRLLERIVARNADSVLCVSADLEDRMRAAGARRVGHAVVPAAAVLPTGGVSAETRSAALRAEFGAEPGPAIVLAVGRLATQKGFGLLLDAAARWRDLEPGPLLVIAGDGPLAASLQAKAAALGLMVRFAGRRNDVPALLAAADVFVLPSAWEGQALILQEALRAAVPIVTTRVGGTPGLVGEAAAILVPPGDAQRLAEAVRAVLGDPALAAQLREAAAARARLLPGEDAAVAAALAEYHHVKR